MSKWDWFKDKMVDAVLVVIFGGLAILIGNGVLQSYLINSTLDKVSSDMKVKFDKDLADAEKHAVKRESDIIAKWDEARAEIAQALIDVKALKGAPPLPMLPFPSEVLETPNSANWKKIEGLSKSDPEKSKLEYMNVQQYDLDARRQLRNSKN